MSVLGNPRVGRGLIAGCLSVGLLRGDLDNYRSCETDDGTSRSLLGLLRSFQDLRGLSWSWVPAAVALSFAPRSVRSCRGGASNSASTQSSVGVPVRITWSSSRGGSTAALSFSKGASTATWSPKTSSMGEWGTGMEGQDCLAAACPTRPPAPPGLWTNLPRPWLSSAPRLIWSFGGGPP